MTEIEKIINYSGIKEEEYLEKKMVSVTCTMNISGSGRLNTVSV